MKRTRLFAKWEKRQVGEVKGCHIEGDRRALSTPSNPISFYFVQRRWIEVAILEAEYLPNNGLYIGFRNFRGEIIVRKNPIKDQVYAVRIGREDCRFFAIDSGGKDIPLKLIKLTTKFDPQYGEVPLY